MRALGRVVLSAVQTPGGLGRTWPDVVATAAPQGPPWIDLESLLNCLILHGAQALADKRGAAGGWTYAQTAAVADLIDTVLLTHFQGEDASDGVTELRVALLALQGGSFGPFQGCPDIWADSTGPCLCRYPVAEPVAEGAFAEAWTAARDEDRASEEGTRAAVWDLSQDAAYQLVEFPVEGQEPELVEELEAVARRTGLCFAQQMLAAEDWAHAATQRRALDELLVESGHRPEPVEADIDPEVVTSEEEPNHGQAT